MSIFSSIFRFSLISIAYFLVSKVAFANGITFEAVMCNAYGLFSGTWGKIFALFALVALGISFFLGKISWGTVLSVGIGIAAIFGGTAIVNAIIGGGAFSCGGSTVQ